MKAAARNARSREVGGGASSLPGRPLSPLPLRSLPGSTLSHPEPGKDEEGQRQRETQGIGRTASLLVARRIRCDEGDARSDDAQGAEDLPVLVGEVHARLSLLFTALLMT